MGAYVVVIYKGQLSKARIDLNKPVITFGSGKKDVHVEGFGQEQVTVKVVRNNIAVYSKRPLDFNMDNVPIGNLVMLDTTRKYDAMLGIFPEREGSLKFKPPYNCTIKVGKNDSNNVILKPAYVSREHFVIKSENGVIRVEDLNSSNGLFLNGKRIDKAKLKSNDILNIFDIEFSLVNGEFTVSNVGKNSMLNMRNAVVPEKKEAQLKLSYHRSLRTRSMLPSEDIILAPPPTKVQKFQKNRSNASSLISSGAMIGVRAVASSLSPAMLAASAAGLISPIMGIANSGSYNSKRKKELTALEQQRVEKYGAYIEDQKALIEKTADEQRKIITEENPAPKDCVNIVNSLSNNLWERMFTDTDFLNTRVGMGYEDLCVAVKSRNNAGNFQMEEDEVAELTEQIVEETKVVDRIPFRLDIRKYQTIGVVGSQKRIMHFVQNMLMTLTTMHSFEDVKVIVITDENAQDRWDSVKWFPHIWDNEKENRYLAYGADEARALCEGLLDLIKMRKEEPYSGNSKVVLPVPHFVLLCDSKEILEKEEILYSLLENNPALGFTTLFLCNEMYQLPPECKYIVELDENSCAYERNEANKRKIFNLDAKLDPLSFDLFARRMSAIELEGLAALSSLPNSITFLDGFRVKEVEELNIASRWSNNKPYRSMATPIGVLPSGKPLMLDLHEKVHGPHGLVAGTTGSGKSEMLLSWILSMAVNYDPREVSFIIIDYKGGGLADRVEALPHTVGKITNIGDNIDRYLQLLNSESMRRQRIFSECGSAVNDIIDYQRLYREGKVEEPLPILFIVADEFAELKRNRPEFLAKLVSIACVGRSLGIRMILATQKPGGIVDDQISSNTSLRLCMKVQSASDSREMIKRPDAARIRQTGRSYIRVGEDAYFDIFQSFWTGATYFGNVSEEEIVEENEVRIVETNGCRRKTVQNRRIAKASDETQLSAVIKEILRVTKENNIVPPPGPLLPELPENFSIFNLDPDMSGRWLETPIGIYDMPSIQKQGIQFLNLAQDGHIGIYGAPGTGKTTLLKTIVTSFCNYYTPEDVNFYILDCGGWSMNVFADMPHVGGVALDCEEEKFLKFEKMILAEFESRKKLFMRNAVSSLKAYRENVAEDLPAIIIAIDNIAPVFDLYPDLEGTFTMISREGATYGIHLIYTANNATAVKYKIMQNVKGAIAFELTDKGDYATLVGRLEGMNPPSVLGRAYMKGQPPVEFQAAQYAHGDTEKEKIQYLKNLIHDKNSEWKGKRPKPIPVMPEIVSKESVYNTYETRTILPFGLNWENIEPAKVDLTSEYSLLISGSVHSGKSRLLSDMTEMVLSVYPETKVYVLDSKGASLSGLKEKVHQYTPVTNDEGVSVIMKELVDHLNVRKRAQNAARNSAENGFDEIAFIQDYEMLCIVVDDLKEFVDEVSDANCDSLERICRLAQNLGVIVLCAGRMADMAKNNEIESLTRCIVSNQNGITVGSTPAQTPFFNNSLRYNEKDVALDEGSAYQFVKGKCSKVKLME